MVLFRVIMTIPAKDELLAIVLVSLTTLLLINFRGQIILANVLMAYLLLVFVVALKLGRRASVLASFLSVTSFAYFFVPPHSSLVIVDPQYVLSLAFMLFIVLVTTHLTSGLRNQVVIAENRENRIRTLYELASELTRVVAPGGIVTPCCRFVSANFNADGGVLLPDSYGKLYVAGQHPEGHHLAFGQNIFDHAPDASPEIVLNWSESSLYIPISGSTGKQGVFVMEFRQPIRSFSPEQESDLKTFVNLIGLALERLENAYRARQASLAIEVERFRNALLASLSHDMRTPVAALAGIANAMQLSPPPLSVTHQAMLDSMRGQVRMILADIDKLLDMARLHSDCVVLHKEWQLLEEIIGSAVKTCALVLEGYEISIRVDEDIPLLEMDAMMMERVFSNLLENVTRHTPVGTRIDIAAYVEASRVVVRVADNGPGLPLGQEEVVFEKFIHRKSETSVGGTGLGLAIVRAVVNAHQGTIHARNLPEGGVMFEFFLPIGAPPAELADWDRMP